MSFAHTPILCWLITASLVLAAFVTVCEIIRDHASRTAEPLSSRVDQLRGLPAPSPLSHDWVYMRLYYAAKDSLETGEPMAQVNVRTEDLVHALYRMGCKGAVESVEGYDA